MCKVTGAWPQIPARMEFAGLAARALDGAAAAGAQYADIRFETQHGQRVEVRNGVVSTLADRASTGYGIRALVDGAWGFAASSDLSDAEIDRTAARAARIARASASIARRRVGAAPPVTYVDTFDTPVE